jgi:adenosine deaminase
MGFTLEDIKSLVLAGFKSAFLPFHIKQSLLRQVAQDLLRFHADGTVDPVVPQSTPPNSMLRTSKRIPMIDAQLEAEL